MALWILIKKKSLNLDQNAVKKLSEKFGEFWMKGGGKIELMIFNKKKQTFNLIQNIMKNVCGWL